MRIDRFEDIEGWKLARELTRSVYRLAKNKGFAHDYELKRQIQAAAGSSMHNIGVFVIFAEPKGIFPGEFSKIGTPNLCTRKPVLRFLRSLR